MGETPPQYTSLPSAFPLSSIKSFLPSQSSWLSSLIPDNISLDIAALTHPHQDYSTTTLITVAALFLTLAYTCIVHYLNRLAMDSASQSPFPFMSLPPELREMVYESLLEDPYYPAPSACSKHAHSQMLSWMMPSRRPSLQDRNNSKKCNWIFMANKQIYAEFMDLLCKKRVFHLTVSPANYTAPPLIESTGNTPASSGYTTPLLPTPPTSSPSPAPSSSSSSLVTSDSTSASSKPITNSKIWSISPQVLEKVRRCDIKLITTSSMLGVPDPRNMTPSSWDLAHRVRSELSSIPCVQELNLHVKAIGDPLWNPLWVWYHACQSFKSMGSAPKTVASVSSGSGIITPASSTSPAASDDEEEAEAYTPASSTASVVAPTPAGPGPKLSRITFSLDTWSPGENHLRRCPSTGDWDWYCMKGHAVGPDGGVDMTVREFCARLYTECRDCRPELESDDEGDEHDHDDDDDQDEGQTAQGGQQVEAEA